MKGPGKAYRVFLILLLLGIFLELGLIASILLGEDGQKGNIAIVPLTGVIEDTTETIRKMKKYEEREDIKAIVLRIDSPGGAVGASQEIYDAVKEIDKKKPVVASMGNVAASGGYYAAAPARKIVANPGTLTGSLGVVMQFFVLEDLLKKAYLNWEVIKSGEVKDLGSPLRPLRPQEREILQAMSDDVHQQFIEAVALGRKMEIAQVQKLADGRVLSGRQAVKVGLVDELGGLEKAIEVAAKLGKIEKPEPIYPPKERFSFLERVKAEIFSSDGLKIEYRLKP